MKQMGAMCLIAAFVLMAMPALSSAGTVYTITINDATETLSASVDPEGTGTLTITPESDDAYGSVYWEYPHVVGSPVPGPFYYNMWEDEAHTIISDTLAVFYDPGMNKMVVDFRSDSLDENNPHLSPYLDGQSVPEVGSLQFALSGPEGDTLMVNYVSPEPGTLALLGSGVLGLMAYAWRRRKRAA